MTTEDRAPVRSGWSLGWIATCAACVLALTIVDAFLIGQSTSLFVGGFITEHAFTSPWELVLFLGTGVLLDAVLVLGVWALAIPLLQRMSVSMRITPVVAGMAALAGPLVFLYVRYELQRHLGEMLDLDVLLEMVGRSPVEWIGQAYAQLLPLSIGVGVLVVAAAGLVVVGRRHASARHGGELEPLAASALWGAFAGVTLAGMAALPAFCLPGGVVCDALQKKPAAMVLSQVTRLLTDFDRDGYGLLAEPADPALFDGRIHPYAVDVPGNGLDENAIAGDHPPGFQPPGLAPVPAGPWPARPDVLVVFLETFRADAIGKRREGREVTPVLNRLAREGASSEHAFVTTPYTIRSLEQLITGQLAANPGEPTMLDDFRAQGYELAYFSAQDETFSRTAYTVMGLDRVDHFFDPRQAMDEVWATLPTSGASMLGWKPLNRRVLAYLEARESDRPLFLYVNYSDSHYPYDHAGLDRIFDVEPLPRRELGPEKGEHVRYLYDNSCANVDRAIGELLEAWRAHSGESTPIVVTADHGEALYEEGYLGHGLSLEARQTRVPLVVAGIGGEWPEPLLTSELRTLIVGNLEAGRAGVAGPHFTPDSDRRILQFTGRLRAPRLLTLRGLDHVLHFDTKEDVLRVVDPDERPLELEPAQQDAEFTLLVRWWESLVHAAL